MPVTDELRLSPAQAEVWTAHELAPNDPQFNCAGYLDLRGPLDADLFEQAIGIVDGECEALRLWPDSRAGGDRPGGVAVRLAARGFVKLQTFDLSEDESAEAVAVEWMADDIAAPLRLGVDGLVRLALFRLASHRHLFYVRYHHLALDGYGLLLYVRRLARVYSALVADEQSPPCLFGGIGDLAAEAQAYSASQERDADRAYWLRAMADPPEPLMLAGTPDGSRGVLRAVDVTTIPTRLLLSAAVARNTHWSVVVTAALAAYLHRLTRQDDFVIGFPVPARTTSLSLATPAMLSNELPLRVSVPDDMAFGALVSEVDTLVRDLLSHQRYRGEELYRALRAARPGAELPNVVANVIRFDKAVTFGRCTGSVHTLSSGPVRGLSFDFYGGPPEGTLRLGVSASGTAYGRSDVDVHRDRFTAFLAAVLTAPEATRIRAIDPRQRTHHDGLQRHDPGRRPVWHARGDRRPDRGRAERPGSKSGE